MDGTVAPTTPTPTRLVIDGLVKSASTEDYIHLSVDSSLTAPRLHENYLSTSSPVEIGEQIHPNSEFRPVKPPSHSPRMDGDANLSSDERLEQTRSNAFNLPDNSRPSTGTSNQNRRRLRPPVSSAQDTRSRRSPQENQQQLNPPRTFARLSSHPGDNPPPNTTTLPHSTPTVVAAAHQGYPLILPQPYIPFLGGANSVPFGYQQAYVHPPSQDPNLGGQPVQTNFQPIPQPALYPYPLPHQSSEDASHAVHFSHQHHSHVHPRQQHHPQHHHQQHQQHHHQPHPSHQQPQSFSPQHPSFQHGYPHQQPHPLQHHPVGSPPFALPPSPFLRSRFSPTTQSPPGQYGFPYPSPALTPPHYTPYVSSSQGSPVVYDPQHSHYAQLTPSNLNMSMMENDVHTSGSSWWYFGASPQPQFEGYTYQPYGYGHGGAEVPVLPPSASVLPPNTLLSPPLSNVNIPLRDATRGSQPTRFSREFPPSPVPAPVRMTSPHLETPSKVTASPLQVEAPDTKPAVRKPYHPNPPSNRSEWVMWAGNVPSDATYEELWKFFTAPAESDIGGEPDDPGHAGEFSAKTTSGVLSIFLISRSSCAFVNFESEKHLQSAITRFNGVPLRESTGVNKFPKLVCRVRKKDDDLKAGVGGQRGIGLHTRWIREQKANDSATRDTGKGREEPRRPGIGGRPLDDMESRMGKMVVEDEDTGQQSETSRRSGSGSGSAGARVKHSSSSGSFASTNSSVLVRYFPKRYFILKSLTQSDLDLSVREGLWATQKHNEGVLDQAFRTSNDVYLIFGVNKSGEFYGYARMAGPVRRGEHRVSWASRTTDSSPSSKSSKSPTTGRTSSAPQAARREAESSPSQQTHSTTPGVSFFPSVEHRLVESSPLPNDDNSGLSSLPLHPGETSDLPNDPNTTPGASRSAPHRFLQSAPAELGKPHHNLTLQTPIVKHSLDHRLRFPPQTSPEEDNSFELDPMAPVRAMRMNQGAEHRDSVGSLTSVTSLQAVAEEELEEKDQADDVADTPDDIPTSPLKVATPARDDNWGESFRVEWLNSTRLPFARTRHIRNPWNHNREIKVSRDGTEVEPATGQLLLDEWEAWTALQQQSTTTLPTG